MSNSLSGLKNPHSSVFSHYCFCECWGNEANGWTQLHVT